MCSYSLECYFKVYIFTKQILVPLGKLLIHHNHLPNTLFYVGREIESTILWYENSVDKRGCQPLLTSFTKSSLSSSHQPSLSLGASNPQLCHLAWVLALREPPVLWSKLISSPGPPITDTNTPQLSSLHINIITNFQLP